ncbi:NF-kappa-B inhibitor alpha-like [Babylonia areolata]|uniref:NF-kappa-B inhibitor alpha-like n=1 Tax=Babylonia areolata TaxID=304850 RepID=UPI003FD22F3F
MADLPRHDLETDEVPMDLQLRRVRTHGRVPQLHPGITPDDKHPFSTIHEDRVDSGVGYSLESQEFSALSVEGVQDFLSTDRGRSCFRQMMDNRCASSRADSISASLQNQLRNLSLRDGASDLTKDSSSSVLRSSRCDSGIGDSVSFSSLEERPFQLEAAFPECAPSSVSYDCGTFSHQELQELFSQDEDGDSYLHMSIIHLLPDVSLKVISVAPHPDCVNIPNMLHQTPLHLAVATRQPLVVRRLMVAGSNLDAPDHCGNTPLHIACKEGLVDMAQLLLTSIQYQETLASQYPPPLQRLPQDLSLRNYEGYTCAHLALQGGHLDVLQLLLAKGANINEPDGKSGRTLLHMAADLGYLPALQLLLRQQGLQLNARTYAGLTAVTLAHGRHLNHVVDLLHHAGADLSQIAEDSWAGAGGESTDEEMNDSVYDDICINGQPVQVS